jgi:hypothetical protein
MMCVDYTDRNNTCKNDPFGLPRIDQVIDSTTGYNLLSFLYCYSGYHQIPLKIEDRVKMSFITPFAAFATTQWLLDSKVQVQRTRGVYKGVYILNSDAMLKHMSMT